MPIERRPILDQYVRIHVWCTRNGYRPGHNDMWIAATAAAAGALLVTNDRDFDPLAGEFISRMYVNPSSLERTTDWRT